MGGKRGGQIIEQKKIEEMVNSIGNRISFDIQPTVSLQIGTNQSSFAFQKGRCYWNEEMPEWQWLTCDYLFISSDCGIVRENIDVLLGSQWALCLLLFEIWLSDYPFIADNAECRENECSRQGIVRKKKTSGVLRCPDFHTAVPFPGIFMIFGKISIVDYWHL